jgi:hypothetical protein
MGINMVAVWDVADNMDNHMGTCMGWVAVWDTKWELKPLPILATYTPYGTALDFCVVTWVTIWDCTIWCVFNMVTI